MAKSPNWTKEEIDILSRVYPNEGCSDNLLSMLPGRNCKGISIKAGRLGLKVLSPWNKLLTTDEYNIKIVRYNIKAISNYVNDRTKILHACLVCNNEWLVRPNNIINGHGCPVCRRCFGFQSNTSVGIASLYLLSIKLVTGERFLKVGVTANPTDLRFVNIKSAIGSDAISLFEVTLRKYSKGASVVELENIILDDSTLAKHTTNLRFSGYTELFEYHEKDKIIGIINNYDLQHEAPKFTD